MRDRARGRRRMMRLVGLLAASALGTAGCAAAAPGLSVTSLPRSSGPVAALPDHASPAQIRRIRTVVQGALTAELAAFDQDTEGRARYTPAQRAVMLEAVEAPPLAAGVEADATAALARPAPRPRTGGRFVAERWQGVQVVGDRAKAFVTGHSGYTPTGLDSQRRDGSGQYQLLLQREAGRWLVIRIRTALDDQG